MNRQNSNGSFTTLKPTKVKLSTQQESLESEKAEASATPSSQQGLAAGLARLPASTLNTLVGIGLLLIVAFVFFILPDWIAPNPTKNLNLVQSEVQANAPATTSASITETPYQKILDARRELGGRSQIDNEKLREIANLQLMLEKLDVTTWAQPDFDKALALTAQGDKLFQQASWRDASEKYKLAHEKLQKLHDSWPQVLKLRLEEIAEAIDTQQFTTAAEKINYLEEIVPDHESISLFRHKLNTYPSVIALLQEAESFIQTGQLENALEEVALAAQINADYPLVRSMEASIKATLIEQYFQQAMSLGLASLEEGHLEQALAAFQKAEQLKPGAAVREGLLETQRRMQDVQIQKLSQLAQQAESSENWKQAVSFYQQALALNANIIDLREGLKRSQGRAALATKIEELITDTTALAGNRRLKQAKRTLALAKKLPGHRLQAQLKRLESAIALAIQPIQLTLISDSQTSVSVVKIGRLGTFKTHNLSLKPGEYTVKGTRQGYHDVVRVVNLPAGSQPKSLVIQCEKPI